jgi:hypothetical protein
MTAPARTCVWCWGALPTRQKQRRDRFCSMACRRRAEMAGRGWIRPSVSGKLTVADLRKIASGSPASLTEGDLGPGPLLAPESSYDGHDDPDKAGGWDGTAPPSAAVQRLGS